MPEDGEVYHRQIWAGSTTTTTHHPHTTKYWCTPLILPTGGVLVLDDNATTTLTAQATFKIRCGSDDTIISPDTTGNDTIIGFSTPFYGSISPQVYALATTTVIAYILVILIFITPRTFYVGGPGGGSGFLSRSGLITRNSNSIVGVGRRPLLQKIAAITVAVSLTIATSDTFSVAKKQYDEGYIDSGDLVNEVLDSVEIRVVRIISDTFLWLAQVQTLIRLFPRHKEKVTIKWLGFALVVCDTVFSILDSFVSDYYGPRPRRYTDAIPALNYLFEISISLIYSSCVVYYSLSKRRVAFWHPKMRNVCLVALLSYVAILIPVVFFILDISMSNIAVWGEYIRWVGAAAASVVVWEWVERIEALERDERKDGILGREIFDGDEMLDVSPSGTSRERRNDGGDDLEKNMKVVLAASLRKMRDKMPLRRRLKRPAGDDDAPAIGTTSGANTSSGQTLTVPRAIVSPPSRSDTASAASTVYAIRYHNITSPSPVVLDVPDEALEHGNTNEAPQDPPGTSASSARSSDDKDTIPIAPGQEATSRPSKAPDTQARQFWASVSHPFKRRRAEPPAEIAGAQVASGMRRSPIDRAYTMKDRFGAFAKVQRDRMQGRHEEDPNANLPIMVIPAPKAEGRTWSPDDVRRSSLTAPGIHPSERRDHAASAPQAHAMTDAPQPQMQPQTQTQDPNIVHIPAPTPGRTWSPQDASQPSSPSQSQQQPQPQPQPPPRTSKPPTKALPPASLVSTPRGSLMITEEIRRANNNSITSRRSPTTSNNRPTSISPLDERLDMPSRASRTPQGSHERSSRPRDSRPRDSRPRDSPVIAAGPHGMAAAPAPVSASTAASTPTDKTTVVLTSGAEDASAVSQEDVAVAVVKRDNPINNNNTVTASSPTATVENGAHGALQRSSGDGRDTGGTSRGSRSQHYDVTKSRV